MNPSTSMTFVMMRAQAEAAAAKAEGLSPDFLLLGILKLAELSAIDFAPTSRRRQAIDDDIAAVRSQFQKLGTDTTRVRGLLRVAVTERHSSSDEKALIDCLAEAALHARQREADKVWAQDVLAAILEAPTDTILQFLPRKSIQSDKKEPEIETDKKTDAKTDKKANNKTDKKENNKTDKKPEDGQPAEMSRGFLPVLTGRIRDMRAQLLSAVHGQDHVVHAFTEGMFAAELLAASDEKRRRSRALFVFAGPPGVGKTFLAEQAAVALDLPYKRFDMSSYSDHQAHLGLVGFEKSYQAAKSGTLTSFVKENPHSILLFDEIEKAHLNTIHLFLQILDAGQLADRYLEEDISFKDTVIIFTSNAGRSLYEGDAKRNAAGIPRKTILNALDTEVNPQTGQPFFPRAITSRMATGRVLLFNHLEAHHLKKICHNEFSRCCTLFERQYDLKTETDSLVPTALLLAEGGQADARTLSTQTEQFFKNEIFKVCRLFSEESFEEALPELDVLRFAVDTAHLSGDMKALFFSMQQTEILLYASPLFAERCREYLLGYVIHDTQNIDEALQIAGERNIQLVIIDIAAPNIPVSSSVEEDDAAALIQTIYEEDNETLLLTAGLFDFTPMASALLRDGSRLFRTLRDRLPELPLFLLETPVFPIDPELLMNFVRLGARGKLDGSAKNLAVFDDMLGAVCRDLYVQGVAAKLAAERKVLYFETAPRISEDRREITVRLRDLSLKRATDADDAGSVLEEVEKPKVRFADVIGAGEAKDELRFFIDYLKNPRMFTAQGLTPPKGILLYGPPGTGKTMLAKAMAGESDVAFIPAAASSFVTKYQGSGPEAVRNLFRKARRYAPAILFIDEIDAIGRKRGGADSAHGEEMALNALLTEMDGFSVDPKRPVFVLAATNFEIEEGQGGMGVIDAALARRFDRKVLVGLPDAKERGQLLLRLLANIKTHSVSEGILTRIAARSTGMSPANLTAVIELANRMAVRAGRSLDDEILDEAYEVTKHGEKKEWGYEYLERVARHESGHALLCYLGGHTPAYLTIVARGAHGGYMEHAAEESNPLVTKDELLNQIRTSLGGRAAEIVYYGEKAGISTGASGDLQNATAIIRAMITNYGMDEEYGIGYISKQEAAASEEIRRRMNQILSEEMHRTVAIINENKPRIDRLVAALMEKNKLSAAEMEELFEEA